MKMEALAPVAAIFLGAGNVAVWHGSGRAEIPGFVPGDVILWSTTEARPECRFYIASLAGGAVTWRCRMHRDCNATLAYAGWKAPNGKEVP